MRTVSKHQGLTFFFLSDENLSVPFFEQCISAGFPSPAQDYREEEINLVQVLKLDSPSVFLVKVEGVSMEGAHVPDKSWIVVDRSITPKSNQIIVAVLNQEFTVKRLVKTASGWMLQPENSMYSPYMIKDEDEFQVWGVVTRIIIDPNRQI